MRGDFSISVRANLGFEESLGLLRRKLQRHEFRVVAQVQLHREFEKTLVLRWRKCTILIVWSPFHAYQALFCALNGGLFLAFQRLGCGRLQFHLDRNHKSLLWPDLQTVPCISRFWLMELNRLMWQILQEIVIYGTAENRDALARDTAKRHYERSYSGRPSPPADNRLLGARFSMKMVELSL